MHPHSPPLTIGVTVLKESDGFVILWVTFDSKMTFEKHLRSVSRAACQRLGTLRKSWWVFHDRSLLGRCFRCFVLPVLEYCSAVWCSADDTDLKLLDRAVSGAWFLTGGVFECDIAYRRSVAVLCVLYKTRCNPMHPLNGALPIPYVPVRLHAVHWLYIGIPMRRLAAESRSTAGLLFPSQCPSETIFPDPVFDGVGLAGSKSGPMFFYWPMLHYPYCSLLLFFPFSSFCL